MNKKNTLIDLIDKETHDNLLHLEKKLTDLEAEIAAKLSSEAPEQAIAEEYKKRLQHLASEVAKALQGIHAMMNLEIEDTESLENDPALEAYSKTLAENVKKLTKLQEKF